LDKLYITNI